MKDEVERGDRIERGVVKESKEGFEVVRETATDIVCMRLVSLMVVEHFSCLLKIMFTSFTSGFTSLSMDELRGFTLFGLKDKNQEIEEEDELSLRW